MPRLLLTVNGCSGYHHFVWHSTIDVLRIKTDLLLGDICINFTVEGGLERDITPNTGGKERLYSLEGQRNTLWQYNSFFQCILFKKLINVIPVI